MRKLKFRVWNGDEKKMYSLAEAFKLGLVEVLERESFCHELRETYLYVAIMQFTGLLDKNGKEIYEGDLIEIVYERRDSNEDTLETKTFIREIIFKDGAFVLKPDFTEGFNSRNSSLTTAKIIGNIYESDLLKS